MNTWTNARTMLIAAGAALICVKAWALSCTIPPATLSGTYDPATNLDASVPLTITCSRSSKEAKNWSLLIVLNQTASQTMQKPAPNADALAYGIYSDANHTKLWTSGTTGGVPITVSFSGNNTSTQVTAPPSYYMRATSGQPDKAAGDYSNTLNATVTDKTGVPNYGSSTVTSQATVPKTCSVAATAISYSVSYQAFQASALVDQSQSVAVSCSKGTQVNLFLDQTTGVINPIGLAYQLGFAPSSAASTSGTASSNTVPMSFGLILTLPAGQAGTCATATCSGNDTRQVLVTY